MVAFMVASSLHCHQLGGINVLHDTAAQRKTREALLLSRAQFFITST
jgi:hypothetical protein